MSVPSAAPAAPKGNVNRTALVAGLAGAILGAVVGGLAFAQVPGMGILEVAFAVVFWAGVATLGSQLLRRIAGCRPRWLGRLLAVLAALASFWIMGDLYNRLLMRRCYHHWEATIERDADSVRAGCAAFQVGEGETALLLVHGFADAPAVYRPMAEALAAKGYACYALRLPHFAEPFNRFATSTAAGWREHLAEQLRHLRRKHRKVVVVAHSLGGAVTVDYLIDRPETVEGVVLLAPLIAVSNQRSPLLTAEAWFHVLDRALIFTDRVAMLLPPDVRDPEALKWVQQDRFIPRSIYRELFQVVDRNRERYRKFAPPLLLVLSRTDQVIDSPTAERFFNECQSTKKELQWVEQAGHVLPIDTGWELLVNDIDRFVRGLPTRDADR